MSRTWVLLRGLIREQRHWEGFTLLMQERFPNDRVVAMDLPGNGTLCQQTSPTRIEGMVVSLREELSARGLRPPFHLVALSLGAMTAISWISDYPGEVAAAALMNSSVARFNPFWQRLRPSNYRRILSDGLLTRDPLRRERAILGMSTNLLDPPRREEIARRWVDYAQSAPVSRRNALRQLLAASRFRAPVRLPALPVLVINGAGDRLVDPGCSRAMAKGWGLPIRVHPEAGHDLTLDDADWVADCLRDWVGAA
ncbi:MAG: alpha/beta fold hydrolase [Alcanivoracaceae bacterium]